MTIFKITVDALALGGGMKVDDETDKMLKDCQKTLEEFAAQSQRVAILGKPFKKVISRTWKVADEKLKDKNLAPEARKEFSMIRKELDTLWRRLDAAGVR